MCIRDSPTASHLSHLFLPLPMSSHRLSPRPTAGYVITPPLISTISSYRCLCHPTASHLVEPLPMSSHSLPSLPSLPTAAYVIPPPPISSYRCLCHPTASHLFLRCLCHPTASHLLIPLPMSIHRLSTLPTASYDIPPPLISPISSYRCQCHSTASHLVLPLSVLSHHLPSLPSLPTRPMSFHRLSTRLTAACGIPSLPSLPTAA